jgi:hypothetical protein
MRGHNQCGWRGEEKNIAFFSYVKELPVGKTIRKDKKKRKRREKS